MSRVGYVLGWLSLGLCFACKAPAQPRRLASDVVAIEPRAHLRHDDVGQPPKTKLATFVLVEAENRGMEPAMVALGGTLRDTSGRTLTSLRPEALLLPAGKRRTFALVEQHVAHQPTAISAEIELMSVTAPMPQADIALVDFRDWRDGNLPIVGATVRNNTQRRGFITVLASFHDAQATPLTRPNLIVSVGAGEQTYVQFVGPAGATRGEIYLGEMTFP